MKEWLKKIFRWWKPLKEEDLFYKRFQEDEAFRCAIAAEYIEEVLRSHYGASQPFMCPLLWKVHLQKYHETNPEYWVELVLMVRDKVHARIGHNATLHAFLKEQGLVTTHHGMSREFVEQHGIPFYENFIKELRGQNEPD